MNGSDMIIINEQAAVNVCFSLPSSLSVIPSSFSFPAPDLNFSSWFTVPAGIHSEWLFIQERIGHFFISVSGLIRTAFRKTCRAAVFFSISIRTFNVLRVRSLKLSYAGRRL